MKCLVEEADIWWWRVATKFNVKHQGKDIHHPPSTIYKGPLSDLPRPTLCPSLSLSFTIIQYSLAHSASSRVVTEYITLLSSSSMQLVSFIGQEAARNKYNKFMNFWADIPEENKDYPSTCGHWGKQGDCFSFICEKFCLY